MDWKAVNYWHVVNKIIGNFINKSVLNVVLYKKYHKILNMQKEHFHKIKLLSWYKVKLAINQLKSK